MDVSFEVSTEEEIQDTVEARRGVKSGTIRTKYDEHSSTEKEE